MFNCFMKRITVSLFRNSTNGFVLLVSQKARMRNKLNVSQNGYNFRMFRCFAK